MQRGFFGGGISSIMQQLRMDDLSNNIANVNTVGYRASRSSFSSYMKELAPVGGEGRAQPPGLRQVSMLDAGKQVIDLNPGTMQQTGNELDLAIQGDAYFTVQLHPGEVALTRAGNFTLDGEGQLTTQNGLPVLDSGGSPIALPAGKVSVTEDGNISVDNQRVAQLGLSAVRDPQQLQKVAGTLLTADPQYIAPAEGNVRIHQGAVESSNVNSMLAMVEMVDAQRAYESTMKIVEQFNQLAAQLADRVGRIQQG